MTVSASAAECVSGMAKSTVVNTTLNIYDNLEGRLRCNAEAGNRRGERDRYVAYDT